MIAAGLDLFDRPLHKTYEWLADLMAQFLARIATELRSDDVDPEQAAWAVFVLLKGWVTKGEMEDVTHSLPAEVQELWP
jgi:uncharacterized protein (DUF2267 family)